MAADIDSARAAALSLAFQMPSIQTMVSRKSSITNAFVNSVIPCIVPSIPEIDAALRVLEDEQDGHPSIDVLRDEYEARRRSGERILSDTDNGETRMTELQRRAVRAQRQVLIRLRSREVIGDDAFHAAEEEIDLLELTADSRIKPGPDDVRQ